MERPSQAARSSPVRVPEPVLRELTSGCFRGLGVREEDAAAVADALMYANLRGIDSHGFDRVPAYMRRVKAGLAAGTEHMAVVAEHGALRRIDAGHALGPAAAVRACDAAAELARRYGVGVVALGNSTNFGAAGFYALRAARAGFLALVTTNAPKLMAPHGAAEPFFGSNPLALAAPLGAHDAFVLDMSSSIMARGKIRRAKALGSPIPGDVALDADGDPTTDPALALAGSMLPFSGPKGSGLAMAMSLFVTLLAEAESDYEAPSIYGGDDRPQNLGQLFILIEPWSVADRRAAEERVDKLVDRLHALRRLPDADAVRYAGERAAERERVRRRSGIPVEIADLEAVADTCVDCGLPELAETARALSIGSG